MKLDFSRDAFRDFQEWISQDRKKAVKITELLADIEKHPFEGIGKPELLKYEWNGWWSRRIDLEHRLVYRVREGSIEVASCRYHYTGN